MTTGGLEVGISDGRLNIISEGKKRKFKKSVEEITFSAKESINLGQDVIFVTERCVFSLEKDGLKLIEVADGIDIQDRKSTRLNSSHANISYAVFCLKKKNIIILIVL